MHRALTLLVLLLAAPGMGCLPRPRQDYSIEQLGQIPSLTELMRVQAATMDPLFSKRDRTSFTDEEFVRLGEASRRIVLTSATLRDRFAAGRKEGFAAYAGQLHAQAGELVDAVEARDAARAARALGAMRQTCRACHKEHR